MEKSNISTGETLTSSESQAAAPAPEQESTPTTQDPKAALSSRMARFKALQAQKESSREANLTAARIEAGLKTRPHEEHEKARHAGDLAAYKLLKMDDPDFERKRAWDYTVEEGESWDKRVAKKERNKNNNAFSDYRHQANKVYKRQIRQLSKVDLEEYAASRAERLQKQVASGLLELVETPDGDVFTVDKQGRVNTPVEENYNMDHKPTKEAVDRLVEQLEKGERARLKARAARGLKDDDGGDVTYINQKNKQFNEKLARFYNKYTTEIRESFERGTAI